MRINKYRYQQLVEEHERFRKMLEPLNWIMDFTPTQEDADALFNLLIGASWDGGSHNLIYQAAWKFASAVLNLRTEEYRDANEGQDEFLNSPKVQALRKQWLEKSESTSKRLKDFRAWISRRCKDCLQPDKSIKQGREKEWETYSTVFMQFDGNFPESKEGK